MSVLITERKDHTQVVEKPLPHGSMAEEDWFAQESGTRTRPEVIPPAARPATATPHEAAVEASSRTQAQARVLTSLLRMADTYRAGGSLHQALEMYFELAREHDGTPQAEEAVERLLDVARGYEQTGELRQARSIYEQLL